MLLKIMNKKELLVIEKEDTNLMLEQISKVISNYYEYKDKYM